MKLVKVFNYDIYKALIFSINMRITTKLQELIDKALTSIQNIDPSSIEPDSDEMMYNENQSINMQPIIDVELQQIDKLVFQIQ